MSGSAEYRQRTRAARGPLGGRTAREQAERVRRYGPTGAPTGQTGAPMGPRRKARRRARPTATTRPPGPRRIPRRRPRVAA